MALYRAMHPNKTLVSMNYDSSNETLSIAFKKGQIRVYRCNSKLAYGLFYQSSAEKELQFYSLNIKGKCQVITVK